MLLQVDVYPHDWTAESKGGAPSQTLFASLASNGDINSNTILKLGRKEGHVLLTGDKSVSREHLLVQLITDNINNFNEKDISRPGVAKTKEEKEACQNDCQGHGLAVVVENLGKFGSFLVVEGEVDCTASIGKNPSPNKNDEDDETDDEDQVLISQIQQTSSQVRGQPMHPLAPTPVPLSPACLHLIEPRRILKTTMKALPYKEGTILLPSLGFRDARVLIQCGKIGSTIVLTRLVRSFCPSTSSGSHGISSHVLTAVGYSTESNVDDTTQFVVSGAYKSTVKFFASWCRRKPVVSSEYFLSYLNSRSSPSDPLDGGVSLNDFSVPPPTDGKLAFFGKTRADPALWNVWTWIRITKEPHEMEVLSCGANIVSLFVEKGDNSDDALVQRAREEVSNNPCCFGISSNRRSFVKKLKEAGVNLLTSAAFLKCLSEQQQPGDTSAAKSRRTSPVSRRSTESATTKGRPSAGSTEDISQDITTAATPLQRASSQRKSAAPTGKKSQASLVDTSPEHKPKVADNGPACDVVKQLLPQNAPKVPKVFSKRPAQDDSPEPVSKPKRARKTAPNMQFSQESKAVVTIPEPVVELPPIQAETMSPPKKAPTPKAPAAANNKQAAPLKGWLQALPRDRSAYVKTHEEMAAKLGIDVDDLPEGKAVTEYCPGLVVAPNLASLAKSSTNKRKKHGGPDFRAFRKNTVLAYNGTHVKLTSVIANVDPAIKAATDAELEALAEQQRRSDELFRDAAVTKMRRRR